MFPPEPTTQAERDAWERDWSRLPGYEHTPLARLIADVRRLERLINGEKDKKKEDV